MANKAFEVYQGLPSWAKGVVVVGGLVLTYIVGKNVSDALKAAKAAREAKERQKQFDKELGQVSVAASFRDSQYTSWADAIASAFAGCDYNSIGGNIPIVGYVWYWSSSGATVWNILNQLKNEADYLKLQRAFGIRDIPKSWICGGDYKGYDLSASITAQLNQKEINALNEMLAKKNINYRF